MRAVIGGLTGGMIGALAWTGAVAFTGYEVGWVAWGVGGLVGYGVAKGNENGSRSSTVAGTLAIVIAALAIVAGKYAVVQSMIPSDDEIIAMFMESFESEEYVISYVADEVAAEYLEEGRELSWPLGVDPSQASSEAEYPREVWAEAEVRWAGRTNEERMAYREALEAETLEFLSVGMPEIRTAIVGGGFTGSFAPMDIIFFGLAMVTAFGLGSGRRKTAEDLAEEYAEAVQLAMLHVMLEDGHLGDVEVRTICRVYEQITGDQVTEGLIRAKATRSRGRDLQSALRGLAPHLTEEGKRAVLRAAITVAVADGYFDEPEKALLSGIGDALGLTEDQLRAAATLATPGG